LIQLARAQGLRLVDVDWKGGVMVQLALPAEWAQGLDPSHRQKRQAGKRRAGADERRPQRWLPGVPKKPRKCSGLPRARSISSRVLTRKEREEAHVLQFLERNWDANRPTVREDCANVPRPCPWVACRGNLYLDVSDNGSIKLNFPHLAGPEEMDPRRSCCFDVADEGGIPLEEVGKAMNLGIERVRQISASGLQEMRAKDVRDGVLTQIRLDNFSSRSRRG